MEAEVIVVGGGHNGLVCAAYLARAGVDTLLVEARDDTGGCASTVSALGARFNICNCDHVFVRSTGIIDELDLGDHGLDYLDLDPSNVAMQWQDQTPWVHFHDIERTLDGLAVTHPGEVDNYRRYVDDMLPLADFVVEVSRGDPSLGAVAPAVARRRGRGVRAVMALAKRSAVDVLRGYFEADTLLTPAVSTGPVVWGVDPHMPGTGLAALNYATKHIVNSGRPIGGSGALTDALRAAFEAAGGRVLCGTRIGALLVEGKRVCGVRSETGDELRALRVVTACDPSIVLAEWVGGEVPARARRMMQSWRQETSHDGYESKIDAVMTEIPVPRAFDRLPDDVDGTGPTLVVGPAVATLTAAHAAAQRGIIADDPVLLVNTPSHPDPTMRPGPNQHVLSLEVLWTPYALAGGWDGSSEPERWLHRFAELVQPNWLDSVVDWRVMTPPDYESQFLMRRGYTPSWAGTPLSAVVGRRRELTRYRTPINGLYLCGAGTFPGAGIWGVSGRNAARVVTRDLERAQRIGRLKARLPTRQPV